MMLNGNETKSNFDFLNKEFPVLANFGRLAEEYCFTDANSCLMKLGMIGENIVNLMFTYDRIPLPEENVAVKRIGVLQREGLLTSDLVSILHELRKKRNLAVHENYSSVEDGKILLQMAFSLCEWFMMTYGDGVCDVNISKLLEFHQSHGKIATLTAVMLDQSKGILDIGGDNAVKAFRGA